MTPENVRETFFAALEPTRVTISDDEVRAAVRDAVPMEEAAAIPLQILRAVMDTCPDPAQWEATVTALLDALGYDPNGSERRY